VTATAEKDGVRVVIADTGPGILSEHLPFLFERFYRADKARARSQIVKSSGAGLGLSIAQSLAQAHGGHIEVASEVGQGTSFTVWLPQEPHSILNS
jgi:signal transduction histidine kinase